jgi:hypothetical protein
MCGELDEEGGPNQLEDALYNAFQVHTRALLAKSERLQKQQRDPLIEKIDKLFVDALSRAARDGENADPAERYQLMAMQPLVFARLAGFMAAHCALQEDPLRKVMEALMHGYAEAERIRPDHGHDHDHDGAHGHFGHQH